MAKRKRPSLELRVMLGEVDVTEYLKSFAKKKTAGRAAAVKKYNAKKRKPRKGSGT